MFAPHLLGLWLLVSAPPAERDLDVAIRHPDVIVAGGAAARAIDAATRADDDAAALAAVAQTLVDKARHPLVAALGRRVRIAEHVRALRLDDAAADLDALGTPRGLRCAGPFDNTGGRGFAQPTAVDDVAAALAGADFVEVRREPRGGFDLDDQLVARDEVRMRCVVAVQAGGPATAALRLAGSGGLAAWHGSDRRVVVVNDADRMPGVDQVAGLVALPRGWSLLMVELSMLQRGGVLDLRLTAPDGAPLKGLRWSTAPADLRAAARVPSVALSPSTSTATSLVGWTFPLARLQDPGFARAAVALLRHTGAWDRRARPTLIDQARDAWVAGAVGASDRARALIDSALADVDDDPSRARARLREVASLEGLEDEVRAEENAATATLREQQGDPLEASAAWRRARGLAPSRMDLLVLGLAFERRRGVIGVPVDREVLERARTSRHRPLLTLAADVLDERGDIAGGLELARQSGDAGTVLLREANLAEARLAVDPHARANLTSALRRRLALHPGSHTVAERLVLLLVEGDGGDEAARILAERTARFPRRPEPLALAARVALIGGDRRSATELLTRALASTPDDGDLQRQLRDLRQTDDDPLVRRVPRFDAALMAAARQPAPPEAARLGAFVHHKVIAQRYFDNGNQARVEDIVIVVTDARRAADLRSFSFGYSGGRERLDVLAAERIGRDGRREAPQQILDRGQEGKENGAYSDARSKTVLFANVDDGDVFHVRTRKETTGLQNQFGDFFGDIEVIDGAMPLRRFEYVIEGPTSRPIFFAGRGAPTPEVTPGPETTTWRFVVEDAPGITGEGGMPPWLEVARSLSISTYSEWGRLGVWYEALIADQLHLDAALRAVVAREKSAATDQRDLVRRLYEFVVTETRYVGIELGIHGWKPYPVTEVYRRRFGDCKDKASLLVALLREAGVPAHLALVRTIQLGHAATDPPSMWTFNHAIAWVEPLNLFLDGTAERSGLDELPPMDQGAAALIVDGAKSRLVTIPVAPAAANDNTSSYVLRIQKDGALVVDGDERFRGSNAARERQRFEDTARQRETLERELAQGIPGANVTAIEVKDLALSQVEVGYRFQATLPKRANVEGDALVMPVSLYPHDLVGSYAEASGRRFDLFLDHPWRTRNVMRYVLPAGMAVQGLPEGGVVDTPWIRFRQVITPTADGFIVDEDTALLSRRIAVADYAAFRDAALAADRLMKRTLRIVPAGAPR